MAEERRDTEGYPEDPDLRTQERRVERMLGELPRLSAPNTLRAEVMAELRATPPGLVTRFRWWWARLGAWRVPIQLAPVAALVLVAVMAHRAIVLGPEGPGEMPSVARPATTGLDGTQLAQVPEASEVRRGDVTRDLSEFRAGIGLDDQRGVETRPAETGGSVAAGQALTEGLGEAAALREAGAAPPADQLAGTFEVASAMIPLEGEAPERPSTVAESESLPAPAEEVEAEAERAPAHGIQGDFVIANGLETGLRDLDAQGRALFFAQPTLPSAPLEDREPLFEERFRASSRRVDEIGEPSVPEVGGLEATVTEPQESVPDQPVNPVAPESTGMRITSQRVEIREMPPPELGQERVRQAEPATPGALAFSGRTAVTAEEMRDRRSRFAVVPAPPERGRAVEERTRLSVEAADPEALIERLVEAIEDFGGLVTIRQPVTRERNIWRVVAELPRHRIEALREQLPHLAAPDRVPAPDVPPAPRAPTPAERERVSVEIMIDRR